MRKIKSRLDEVLRKNVLEFLEERGRSEHFDKIMWSIRNRGKFVDDDGVVCPKCEGHSFMVEPFSETYDLVMYSECGGTDDSPITNNGNEYTCLDCGNSRRNPDPEVPEKVKEFFSKMKGKNVVRIVRKALGLESDLSIPKWQMDDHDYEGQVISVEEGCRGCDEVDMVVGTYQHEQALVSYAEIGGTDDDGNYVTQNYSFRVCLSCGDMEEKLLDEK